MITWCRLQALFPQVLELRPCRSPGIRETDCAVQSNGGHMTTLDPPGGEGVNQPLWFPEPQRPKVGVGWVPEGKSGPS